MIYEAEAKRRRPAIVQTLERWFIARVWQLHAPVLLLFAAPSGVCLRTLVSASRPSSQRLHLTNLFTQGRRYQIMPRTTGFRMRISRKDVWRYRRRTRPTAVMTGTFSRVDDETSQLRLTTRIHSAYLADVFLLPTLMASLIVTMPWPLAFKVLAIGMLYLLSWVGHRTNARLEANDMIWFVRKALEEYANVSFKALNPQAPDVLPVNEGFESAWQQFYDEMQGRADDA